MLPGRHRRRTRWVVLRTSIVPRTPVVVVVVFVLVEIVEIVGVVLLFVASAEDVEEFLVSEAAGRERGGGRGGGEGGVRARRVLVDQELGRLDVAVHHTPLLLQCPIPHCAPTAHPARFPSLP